MMKFCQIKENSGEVSDSSIKDLSLFYFKIVDAYYGQQKRHFYNIKETINQIIQRMQMGKRVRLVVEK